MTLLAMNLTSIGASHIRIGKECQDFSLSTKTDTYAMAITADGHGGDNYFRSAYGSCFAAQAASACISEFMQDWDASVIPSKPEELLVQLEKSIIAKWNASVWEHYEANPFTEDELNSVSESRRQRILSGKSIESTYGSTLIVLVWTNAFWFGLQIGDGKCVRVKRNGEFDQPIPPNDKCFLNSTTSICDENAIEDFRHCFSTEMPAAIFCGSDGIDDSFIRDEQLYKLYSTIARSLAEKEFESAYAELEDYLPRLSSKGSGDDVSIAGILDKGVVIQALPEIEVSSQGATEEVDSSASGSQEAFGANEVKTVREDVLGQEAEADLHSTEELDDSVLPFGNREQSAAEIDELAASGEDVASVANELEARVIVDEAQPCTEDEKEEQPALTQGSDGSWFSEDEGSSLSARPKFCTNCGYKLDESNKFCPECGTPIELVKSRVLGSEAQG